MTKEKLVTIRQVCETYNVTRATVENWIKQGMPVEIKRVRFIRLKFSDVDSWLKNKDK